MSRSCVSWFVVVLVNVGFVALLFALLLLPDCKQKPEVFPLPLVVADFLFIQVAARSFADSLLSRCIYARFLYAPP